MSVIESAVPRDPDRADGAPLLELRGVTAGFGELTVLRDVNVAVAQGQAVALLGPNGAGKTTMLRLAAGLMRPRAGAVLINGEDVTRRSSDQRARRGLCLIPEGRGIFRNLSVRDNLRLGVPPWRSSGIDDALEAFPILRDRLGQAAGTLSGGEQQMLALARSYLAKPSVVLLDEISMGLAPKIVDQIFASLATLAATGIGLLLVEQYVERALEMVDQVYLLNRGRITHHGPAAEVTRDTILSHYMGESAL
jgi:branched-chain amino acid transport system ATP-binding protein